MTEYSFSLIPFPAATIPEIQITGRVARNGNLLSILYSLTGDIDTILFPPVSKQPVRKDELWTSTCFEFFLALPSEPQYWEFNLSPSGDWNIYRMDAYRRVGFQEETSIQRLLFSVHHEAARVVVDATVDLSPIIDSDCHIQLGITSVIQSKDRTETYWALTHPNPQADFHLRESFTIELS